MHVADQAARVNKYSSYGGALRLDIVGLTKYPAPETCGWGSERA
jgi:hypothetical protein